MKKRYLALILILSLLLSACSVVTTPVNTDETNAQLSVNKYRLLNDGICETGDFFFGGYAGGQYLYYYDKENGVSDYLCADPSCAHNTQSCGAFVSRTGLATFYEGKRYWVTYGTEEESGAATLWCSDLGGTNRKRIKKLSYESMGQYAPQVNMIYKGSLYMQGNVNVVEGITVGNRMTLLRTSLDGKEEVEILFDEIFKSNLQYRVNFVGDDAYLGINTWSEDGYDSIKIERIGLSTNHRETVFEEKDIPEMIGKFWITEEGEIYIPGVDKFWKVENGQRTMVSDISEGISPAEIDDGIVLQTYIDAEERYIEVKNLNGTTIYHGKIFPDAVEGILGNPNSIRDFLFGIYGGDQEKLLVEIQKKEKSSDEKDFIKIQNARYYLTLDLKNNMTPTLLWTATQ